MAQPACIRYGHLRLDPRALDVRDGEGRVLPITPMGVRLLLLLHEHLDELVTRRAIYDALWPDSEIDVDRGLNTLIRHVRRGLGDSTDSPRFIRT